MRVTRSIFALYVFVWFSIVVPAHTRGTITVPGSMAGGASFLVSTSAAPCCEARHAGDAKGKPTPQQQRSCAVCFVASTYTVPVVYVHSFEPGERVEQLVVSTVAQVLSLDLPSPYWPTGPPALSA